MTCLHKRLNAGCFVVEEYKFYLGSIKTRDRFF